MPRGPLREARFEATAQAQTLADSIHALVASARARARGQVIFLFQLPDDTDIPEPVEIAACRMCEMAVGNALRRADSRRLTVELTLRHERLIVRVADDGEGFDASQVSGLRERVSLDVMQACVHEAGGRFDVRSAPGAGTCISALFPLEMALK